jgi:HAD superfamily phosphoserine phosphatase-like hydrolase
MITTGARELVARHAGAGDLCAIVTATNSFVTRPIAEEFGVPHLIATEPESVNGRFTGRVAGTPCFREGKVERVADWLAGLGVALQSFAASTFYSDSHNDRRCSSVTEPVAVDPDPQPEAEAACRRWRVMSLRSQAAPA